MDIFGSHCTAGSVHLVEQTMNFFNKVYIVFRKLSNKFLDALRS